MPPTPLPYRRLLRAALWLLPLGVLANVAVTLGTTDRALLAALDDVPVAALLLAAAMSLVPWVVHAARIRLWTAFVGHPIAFIAALRICAGGTLGSAVTPTAVGGGTIRWALTTSAGLPPGKAASLLAVEAVEDLVFFALAVPVVVVVTASSEASLLRRAATSPALRLDDPVFGTLAVVAAVLIVALLAWRPLLRGRFGARPRRTGMRLAARLRRPLRKAWTDLKTVLHLVGRDGKRTFLLALAMTSVQWIARYSVGTVLIVALGGPFEPVLFWMLSWMTYAVSSAVPTPGAAGGAEATFFLLHSPFVPAAILGLATALWRLTLFYLPAIAAAIAFPLLGRLRRAG